MHLEFICAMDDLVEHVEQGSLLVNQQFGVPHDVCAKHMSDLQFDFFLNFGSHVYPSLESGMAFVPPI